MDHEAPLQLDSIRIAELRSEAENEIRAILQRLETTVGRRIERLSLNEIDVTACGDKARQLLTAVSIEFVEPAQRRWS